MSRSYNNRLYIIFNTLCHNIRKIISHRNNKNYKRNILLERDILEEKNTRDAYLYAENIIKARWPDAESFIMTHPGYAYMYARNIINGRWSEAEPFIIKNPKYAYYYAKDIIKGIWPEAEVFMIENQKIAFMYAINILENRFPLLETKLFENKYIAGDYCATFESNYNILCPLWLKHHTGGNQIIVYFQ